MTTLTVQITLVSEVCCNCGVVFGLEKVHRQSLIDSGGSFYCPNGHAQHYTDTTINQLKRRIESLKEDGAYYKARIENERRSHAATKGHLTRAKKRIGNGVCPCCNRHFTNVQRHMETQHPDYKEG